MGTSPPKKFKVSESAGKMVAVFGIWKGFSLIDYKEKGDNITGQCSIDILERLKVAIKEFKASKMVSRKKVSAFARQRACSRGQYRGNTGMAGLYKCGFEELIDPPHSPDQTPSDFLYLYTKFEKDLRVRKFTSDEEV